MTPVQFRTARKALGLTQSGMAEALSINKRTVQRAETGEWPVSPRTASHVRALLNQTREA